MTRTRKNPQAEWVKTVDTIAQAAPRMSSAFSVFKADPESSPELLDLVWGKDARTALTIPDGNRDLRRTFERFNLDPADPWSWRQMAEYMAMVVSLPQRKRGRPVVYTPEKLMEILKARDADGLKNLPDTKAAKRLAPTQAGSSRKSGAEGLRKQIRKARLGTK